MFLALISTPGTFSGIVDSNEKWLFWKTCIIKNLKQEKQELLRCKKTVKGFVINQVIK